MAGSQDYAADPRNEHVKIYLNGALVPRADAKVSIFDAGYVLGDGVWEGFRLHKGTVVFADRHFDRDVAIGPLTAFGLGQKVVLAGRLGAYRDGRDSQRKQSRRCQ